MRDFFKGWNRKAGVVTLALTLLLLVGWIRSNDQCDILVWTFNQSRYGINSLGNRICLSRQTPAPDPEFSRPFDYGPVKLSMVGGFRDRDRNADGAFQPFDPIKRYDGSVCSVRWRWDWIGLHAGVADQQDGTTRLRIDTCVFPHWSIVIPLTLFSAWLLLSKPRSAQTPKQESH